MGGVADIATARSSPARPGGPGSAPSPGPQAAAPAAGQAPAAGAGSPRPGAGAAVDVTASPVAAATGCPGGSLRWSLSSFNAAVDPLDARQVTVTMAGSVTNAGTAPATVLDAQEILSVPPLPGAAAYPVYLVLTSTNLAPGSSTTWQGRSPEVGYKPSQIARGRLAVSAAWAAAPSCPAPGHAGTP